VPDAPGLELIRGEIEQDHPGAILDTGFDHGAASMSIDPAHVLAVLTWLRDAPGQGYRFLSSLHAADYLPAAPRFAVHYELLNRDRVERLRVKALLADPASSAGGADSGGPRTEAKPPPAGPPEAVTGPAAETLPCRHQGDRGESSLSVPEPRVAPPKATQLYGESRPERQTQLPCPLRHRAGTEDWA